MLYDDKHCGKQDGGIYWKAWRSASCPRTPSSIEWSGEEKLEKLTLPLSGIQSWEERERERERVHQYHWTMLSEINKNYYYFNRFKCFWFVCCVVFHICGAFPRILRSVDRVSFRTGSVAALTLILIFCRNQSYHYQLIDIIIILVHTSYKNIKRWLQKRFFCV